MVPSGKLANDLGTYIGTVVAGDVVAAGMTLELLQLRGHFCSRGRNWKCSGRRIWHFHWSRHRHHRAVDIVLTGIWRAIAFGGIGGFNNSNQSVLVDTRKKPNCLFQLKSVM